MLRFTGAAAEPLWRDLDLEVPAGGFLAVVGPNGCGKSTLLACALGTRALSRGSVVARGPVGWIPQQRMFPRDLPMRVRDLVSLAAGRAGRDRVRVTRALAEVGAAGLADRRVGTLSGGQQQLVRQAQALVREPRLILADEPLLSLDAAAQRATMDRLAARRDAGAAVVMVTHAVAPVLGVADRVLHLGRGGHRLGPPAEILDPATLAGLGVAEPAAADPGVRP